MQLNGEFVFVCLKTSNYEGKTYYKVTLESNDMTLQVSTSLEVAAKMTKYQRYVGAFNVGVGKDGMFMRLVDVRPAASKAA